MRFLSALAVLFALCLSPMSYGAQYYAKLTTSVAGGSNGGGKVYASNSPTENENYYGAEDRQSVTASRWGWPTWLSGSATIDTLYAFAKPDDGFRFVSWGGISSGVYTMRHNPSITTKKTSSSDPQVWTDKATFERIQPREIILCVGDVAKLHYDIAGGATTEKYAACEATGGGNIIDLQWEGLGASTASGDSTTYRSCCLTITALEPGESQVRLRRKVTDDVLTGDYDIINVVVREERRLKRGTETTVSCACTAVSQGNATWSDIRSDDNGVATITGAAAQTPMDASFMVRSVEAGKTTVYAVNTNLVTQTTGSGADRKTEVLAYSGAAYAFAVEVLPIPRAEVRMTQGASMKVVARDEDVQTGDVFGLDKTTESGISAQVDSASGVVTFSVVENAAVGASARFTVAANDRLFQAYNVTVTEPIVTSEGKSHTEMVQRSAETWEIGSDDESVARIVPTGTGMGHSARIDALSLGDATCWATNANASATNYAYRVQVRGENARSIALVAYDDNSGHAKDYEVVTCGLPGRHGAPWTAVSSQPGVASVALNTSDATDQIQATITGLTVGTSVITVRNAYYTETINVRVVRGLVDRLEVPVGESVEVSNAAFGTSSSANELSAEPRIATARLQNGKLSVTGVSEGTTEVEVEENDFTALYTVRIYKKEIDKTVKLAYSLTQTDATSAQTDTYDAVTDATAVSNDGIVSIATTGNSVTFTATKGGEAKVDVTCKMDGLASPVTVHYTITVTDVGNRGVWPFGDGYILYENVSDIRNVGDDVLITFANSAQAGSFEIPEPLVAMAEVLAVGGGGAGGGKANDFGRGGGGGGAGGLVSVNGRRFVSGNYPVTVGAGGVNDPAGAAAQGAAGGASQIRSSQGGVLVEAAGGGGGGTGEVVDGAGAKGGSGGGGSWSASSEGRQPGAGGPGVDGQGAAGGRPGEAIYNCGAGGGGAGGLGGTDGTGGLGKASTITGSSVIYAVGGAGGVNDRNATGAAGAGVGFGGQGGSGQVGGAGHDGAVIVRLTSLRRVVKVPVPTTDDVLTLNFEWADGLVCVPIDYAGKTFRSPSDQRTYAWSDALATVTYPEVVCSKSGSKYVGVGSYMLVLHLKDGYAWDTDGDPTSSGSIDDQRFRWYVLEPGSSGTEMGSLEANKYVSWQKNEHATITILAKSVPTRHDDEAAAYDLTIDDKVIGSAAGLDLRRVDLSVSADGSSWVTNATWTTGTGTIGGLTVSFADSTVRYAVSDLRETRWTKVEIAVEDNGIFRTNIGATYNEQTGLYEKNPNDGTARVSMTSEGESIVENCETEIPWSYVAHPVEVYAENGEIYVNGTSYNPYALYEGAEVTVYYRGKGGYELSEILVDDMPIEIVTDPEDPNYNLDHYTIPAIDAPHTVVVKYERFYGDVSSSPANYMYDGQGHVYPITLSNWKGGYQTEVRYALELDAPEAQYLTADEFCTAYRKLLKDSGVHRFAYRVFAYQPGYGATLTEPGWAWVDTGRQGTSTVTIEPLDLIVQPKYVTCEYEPKSNWDKAGKVEFSDVANGWENVSPFVEGEGWDLLKSETNTWSVVAPDYSTEDYKTSKPDLYETQINGIDLSKLYGVNYRIRPQPGFFAVTKRAFRVNGVPQGDHLDPENEHLATGVQPVRKVYDGVATGLTVNVTDPTSDDSNFKYRVLYRNGDSGTWSVTPPEVIHVGTYKIYYALEQTEVQEAVYMSTTNYQYVTILPRPITVKSLSAMKSYDGTELTKHEYEITSGSLASGDKLMAKYTGSQTIVDTSYNKFSCTVTGVAQAGDYDITVETGTLTVTLGKMTINGVEQPDNPKRPLDQGKTGVADVVKNYDGEPANLVVTVGRPEGALIEYSLDKVKWYASSEELFDAVHPALVDVGEYVVHYRVTAPNYATAPTYATVQNFGRVIIKPAVATALAIVDHCDAGNGKVHLAFRPVVAGGLTKEYVLALAANNGLAAVFGTDEASLATAEPVPVTLRDPTGELDLDKGLVWVTVDVKDMARPLYCKIVILEARQDR